MTYRDYDSTTARWLNEDPLGLAGGINLYGYVRGNPLSRVDPSGLVSRSMSAPQRIETTTRAIGGACGRYDPNALFTGGCMCVPGGFQAALIVSFHPKIYVATDIMTPPDVTYHLEITVHHAATQALVDTAIAAGERIERRVFSSDGECTKEVADWVKQYSDEIRRRTFMEVVWDWIDQFKCDARPKIV